MYDIAVNVTWALLPCCTENKWPLKWKGHFSFNVAVHRGYYTKSLFACTWRWQEQTDCIYTALLYQSTSQCVTCTHTDDRHWPGHQEQLGFRVSLQDTAARGQEEPEAEPPVLCCKAWPTLPPEPQLPKVLHCLLNGSSLSPRPSCCNQALIAYWLAAICHICTADNCLCSFWSQGHQLGQIEWGLHYHVHGI